ASGPIHHTYQLSRAPDATAGPNQRAGFMAAPVSRPPIRMAAATARPMAKPPSRGARLSTAVPRTTSTRTSVSPGSGAAAAAAPLGDENRPGSRCHALLRAGFDGAPGGTRTPDARLRTAALYPLSYGGAVLPSYPTRAGGAVTDRPAARRVVLYERSGCHLCDEVRVLLDAMLGHDAYERVDVDADDALVLR